MYVQISKFTKLKSLIVVKIFLINKYPIKEKARTKKKLENNIVGKTKIPKSLNSFLKKKNLK